MGIRRDLGFVVMPRRLGRHLSRLNYRFKEWYYEIRNRFFARYYLLDIKAVPRGQWRDCDYRLFHGVFQMLVDFVEEECAHLSRISYRKGEDYDDIHPTIVEWQNASWWDRWHHREFWKERLGLAHLDWGASLDDPKSPSYTEHCEEQAEHARKTRELYLWYKGQRPHRIDPYDAYPEPTNKYVHEDGGFTDEMIENKPSDEITVQGKTEHVFRGRQATEELREYYRKVMLFEESYENEDTAKAQQVLAIRRGLWT